MDAWQFALFFVALVVGYVLVHLRLVRFEEHLQKLAGIRSMDDRLRVLDERLLQIVEGFERIRLDRIENKLERLHDDLEDLREATTDVRQAVVQLPAPVATDGEFAAKPPIVVPEPAGTRVRALVEGRLLQLGYGNLDILTDLSSLHSDNDVEVQVECERNGMPVKGRVIVRNGSVRDVAMQSAAQMFP